MIAGAGMRCQREEGLKTPLIPSFDFTQDRLYERGKLKKGGIRQFWKSRNTVDSGITWIPTFVGMVGG
jgi:hypothetical protein